MLNSCKFDTCLEGIVKRYVLKRQKGGLRQNMKHLILTLSAIAVLIAPFAFGDVAQAACSRCVGGPEWLGVGELGIDLDMPDLNSNEPEEIMKVEEDVQKETEENDSVDIASETKPNEPFEEKWSLRLTKTETGTETGTEIEVVDLVLFQSGEALFGSGNLSSDGCAIQMGVCGSAKNGAMDLSFVPVDGSCIYRMALISNGESLSGRYDACDQVETTWSGIVEGFR